MSRTRAIVALLALVLALPSTALAQGAGDEQYQDPFGGEQTQGGGGGQDDGLSDQPPVEDGGEQTTPPAGDGDGGEVAAEPRTLPNTGADPRVLAWVGVVFLLAGVGLRLRTVDPDSF